MTSHRYTRCVHCSVVFVFQRSGAKVDWYENQSDSDTWCKTCWAAVTAALAAVPRQCEKFHEEVTDPEELERVAAAEKALKENPPKLFGMVIVEQGCGLYKIENGKTIDSMIPVIVRVDNVRYNIQRWRNGSKPTTVLRAMERNLTTKATQPWKDYNR